MKALTLIQPWAWAITTLGKRVENRGWKPPARIIGQRIAIHAGKSFDNEAAEDLREEFGFGAIVCTQGAIVATAVISHVVEFAMDLPRDQQIWFFGRYGWVLDDVRPVDGPRIQGKLGLWELPADIATELSR